MREQNGFSRCAEFYIGRLRKEGRHSTAHVYKNALPFSKFCGTLNVSSLRQVTRKVYGVTGSTSLRVWFEAPTRFTYMRMFVAFTTGEWKQVLRLMCRDCFMMFIQGVDIRQKKALPAVELHKLLYRRSKVGAIASYTGYCCPDVPVLWNVVCRFGSFGEIGFGSECVAV